MKQTIFQAKYLTAAAFFLLIYFPVFHHLDWEPIHNWDEALFAMRASYMAEEGKYLPSYNHWIEDGPRHLNSKPPFTTWIQVLSVKTFGISELALRIPTALAVFSTILLLLYAARNILGDIRIGYCAGFVLITSRGFMREHVARTADQDAFMAFYMLAAAIAFYQYLESTTDRQRWKWLAIITLSTIAAALTKYVLGFFFMPAFAIYAAHKGQLLNILKRGSTWLAAALVIGAVSAWFVAMDAAIPGFIHRAFSHEMIDRYTSTLDVHYAPWFYYFKNLHNYRFMPWLYFLVVPLFVIFSKKTAGSRPSSLLMLIFLSALSLLVIISFSQTKTPHYDAVAYPPLALLAGFGLLEVLKACASLFRLQTNQEYRYLAFVLVPFFVFVPFLMEPYNKTLEKTYTPKLQDANLQYGYLFRQLEHYPGIRQFTVVYPGFDGQAVFYAGLYNRKKGYQISLSDELDKVQPGDTIMACDKKIVRHLFEKWELQGITSYDKCFLATVISEKKLPLPND